MKKCRCTIALALICMLLVIGTALAGSSANYAVDWQVLSSGGAPAVSGSEAVALNGSLGQLVVGVASSASSELCAGFWCGTAIEYSVYLPLVLRNA